MQSDLRSGPKFILNIDLNLTDRFLHFSNLVYPKLYNYILIITFANFIFEIEKSIAYHVILFSRTIPRQRKKAYALRHHALFKILS